MKYKDLQYLNDLSNRIGDAKHFIKLLDECEDKMDKAGTFMQISFYDDGFRDEFIANKELFDIVNKDIREYYKKLTEEFDRL